MTDDPILNARPGTFDYRQRFVRAHLPDGRTHDSTPTVVGTTTIGDNLKAAFGRMAFPAGTRFEAMERTVTVTATEWAPAVARAEANR